MDKRENMVSFRLNDQEFERVSRVVANVLARNRYIKKADIYRELFGLVDTGAISIEEKAYLKGDIFELSESVQLVENIKDQDSPSLFAHSAGNDKPANTKSRAIQKDIEDVQKEAKRRIRELKEKEKKKL